jgi:hypothetical protein
MKRRIPVIGTPHLNRARTALGLPSKFEWKRLLLLRGGYVRELAVAVIFFRLQVARAVNGG